MSRVCVGDSGNMSCSWDNQRTERSLELSDMEMEAVTTVFRSFETGLREASIDTKVGKYEYKCHDNKPLSRTCWPL